MTARQYSSVAVSTTINPGILTGATSIVVAATTGWPSSYPYTVILDEDTAYEELVEVTAAGGTTLTVVRGKDGTTAQAHNAGATARHAFSARDFSEPQVHMAASSGVHGATGPVVGTTDVQTLTNKTLTTPTIASMLNANHTHAAGSGGGLIPQSSVTNLPTSLTNIQDSISTHGSSTTNVHGLTGTVVGTSETQTLTNKTLTAPTIGDLTNANHDHSAANKGGIISMPLCRVYATAVSTIAPSTTTLISFNGSVFDPRSPQMHSNATNPSRLIAPVAGYYVVNVRSGWTASTPEYAVSLTVRKNAAGSSSGGTLVSGVSGCCGSVGLDQSHQATVYLAANDYVEVFRAQTSAYSQAPASFMEGYPASAEMRLVSS